MKIDKPEEAIEAALLIQAVRRLRWLLFDARPGVIDEDYDTAELRVTLIDERHGRVRKVVRIPRTLLVKAGNALFLQISDELRDRFDLTDFI